MDKIRIALIGYGNVGKAFADMLLRRADYIRDTFGTEPVITAMSPVPEAETTLRPLRPLPVSRYPVVSTK